MPKALLDAPPLEERIEGDRGSVRRRGPAPLGRIQPRERLFNGVGIEDRDDLINDFAQALASMH